MEAAIEDVADLETDCWLFMAECDAKRRSFGIQSMEPAMTDVARRMERPRVNLSNDRATRLGRRDHKLV